MPSGRLVHGRGLRDGVPVKPQPEFSVYLQADTRPDAVAVAVDPQAQRRLPADFADAHAAVRELYQRAAYERVEVACTGGRSHTGTALAYVAVLDGVPAADAVNYVRSRYHPHAVETPWQQAYVRHFRP